MCRCACLMLIAATAVCGCKREDPDTKAPTATTPQASAARARNEKPQTPPVPAVHPVVTAVREFLDAVAGRDFDRAVAQGTPGTFSRQTLLGINQAFQLDQASVAHAWLATRQAAVVTSLIPTKEGSRTAAWGFAMIAGEDGQWQIRSADFLPDQDTIDTFLAAFREAEPDARALEP